MLLPLVKTTDRQRAQAPAKTAEFHTVPENVGHRPGLGPGLGSYLVIGQKLSKLLPDIEVVSGEDD